MIAVLLLPPVMERRVVELPMDRRLFFLRRASESTLSPGEGAEAVAEAAGRGEASFGVLCALPALARLAVVVPLGVRMGAGAGEGRGSSERLVWDRGGRDMCSLLPPSPELRRLLPPDDLLGVRAGICDRLGAGETEWEPAGLGLGLGLGLVLPDRTGVHTTPVASPSTWEPLALARPPLRAERSEPPEGLLCSRARARSAGVCSPALL